MLPKSKLWAILLLVAVAVAGFAAGAGWSRWAHRRARPDARGRESYAARLAQELGMDSAQSAAVRAVLDRYRPQMQAAFEAVRPRMDSLRTAMRSDIRALLSDEQRTRYDSVLARERAMRERASPPSRRGRN